MLLVHKDISHMPITELEKDSESIWVKVFANKTSHFVAGWYRPPGSTSEEFQLFREQPDYIRTHHKGKKLPSAHVLGDFNFKDIDWPDRLSKSGSTLSTSIVRKRHPRYSTPEKEEWKGCCSVGSRKGGGI